MIGVVPRFAKPNRPAARESNPSVARLPQQRVLGIGVEAIARDGAMTASTIAARNAWISGSSRLSNGPSVCVPPRTDWSRYAPFAT